MSLVMTRFLLRLSGFSAKTGTDGFAVTLSLEDSGSGDAGDTENSEVS